MENISLDNKFKLSFEKLPHTIRLIVSKNNDIWVCKKEKLKNLFAFADDGKEHLFKGRLQLIKRDNKIDIRVKHELIDTISTESFKQVLSKLK
ncbi:glycogen/starch/alpha-glucan phosphorylase [Pedobacter sp. Leaf170]|uniref:glycogen/starch/alpha-glucan phosphorylase n=1 Tax=Pedobacter sp. Leaf170 TaxID=2876558 RepID=UPI001E56694F|nr:glycogen/starch/alpha-glucan phosphorylase [Pedobacter sp. Leaf170]